MTTDAVLCDVKPAHIPIKVGGGELICRKTGKLVGYVKRPDKTRHLVTIHDVRVVPEMGVNVLGGRCFVRKGCLVTKNKTHLDIVSDNGRGVGVLRAYPCELSALFFVDMVLGGMNGMRGAISTPTTSLSFPVSSQQPPTSRSRNAALHAGPAKLASRKTTPEGKFSSFTVNHGLPLQSRKHFQQGAEATRGGETASLGTAVAQVTRSGDAASAPAPLRHPVSGRCASEEKATPCAKPLQDATRSSAGAKLRADLGLQGPAVSSAHAPVASGSKSTPGGGASPRC